MFPNEIPPSTVDKEAEQRIYDAAFLRFLSTSLPTPPNLTPGCRRVTTQGYEITLDTSHQVLGLSVPEREPGFDWRGSQAETPLFPSFAELPLDASEFAPAAALALKAKQFDDGLYACVEMAADAGLDRFPAKKELLLQLLKVLSGDSDRTAAALLTAAARLGGDDPQVYPDIARRADELQEEFLGDALRSKVLGFYTWSEELARIFRRDRMLQTEIGEETARALAVALSRDDKLLQAYTTTISLMEKLTNPLVGADLREPARALKGGGTPSFPKPPELMAFFPASRAYETDLIKKLFPFRDQPIPEGFNLADEIIKRIRAGALDLKPTPASGWYDHQAYTLEPLAVPERMPEGAHLKPEKSYRKELLGLFKALLSLSRETHIKQVEVPIAVGASPRRLRLPDPPRLQISPGLTVEPLPTYYQRRARSYRFVSEVLRQAFGSKGLPEMRRLTAAGPVNLSLAAELGLMEALFQGAYLLSCEEIGMTPEEEASVGSSEAANTSRALLGRWLASVRRDPDLGEDTRMMVPIFYDRDRKKTKVWAVLGIATKPLAVYYDTKPIIKEFKGPHGKRIDLAESSVGFLTRAMRLGFPKRHLTPNAVEFVAEQSTIAYIATAEVYVTRLLNRTEFRRLCDRHKTYKAIVDSLK